MELKGRQENDQRVGNEGAGRRRNRDRQGSTGMEVKMTQGKGLKRYHIIICGFFVMCMLGLWGCGSPAADSAPAACTGSAPDPASGQVSDPLPISSEEDILHSGMGSADTAGAGSEEDTGLVYERSMELQYAQEFSVDYYEGGYVLLTIGEDSRFLVVPEGKAIPGDVEKGTVVLERPVENLYLAASAVMDMFRELDAIDTISFSGQSEEGWYIEEAKEAMISGDMIYAGKYNKPDYELIVSKDCSLAIENTMILHSPEVAEKLEEFGIPVLVEHSSYESHPLGRVEWIKLFGALLGREEEAEKVFQEQIRLMEDAGSEEKTDKTAAFFFITSNGLFQVRQSSDYIPKMMELAGGRYIFDDLGDADSARSTMNMQVEEFYNGAKDADFLIYNSSIDGGITSVEELLDKCKVLEDFKAVQEGNVWCTTNDMYQQSMSIGYLIKDMHTMFSGGDERDMKYLFRLEDQ